MLDTIEFVLKILFFILSIVWVGKIMILRTDKQIVINPILILISALIVIVPESNESIKLFGVSTEIIKIMLYSLYSLVVLIGIYVTKRKNGIF
ncbi:hypothetical protein [Clostridium sp. CCUG 7971]|uniref:hypothetical protein n=1 Tax=Clostridium sp. CCUG 7971 TaxID=2811414 RepID=UPI001ABB26E2|nr:hypothetical protein [Clostridium sp. CCUG 7971]MBO3445553.1 hypothetical protein [Clostridium sp. CCUG 7971]